MTFPPNRTMFSLGAMDNCNGGQFAPDGRMYLTVRVRGRDQLWQMLGSEIDDLTARGWLELLPPRDEKTAVLVVTDAGQYWLARWANKHRGRLEAMAAAEQSILVTAN